MGNHLALQSLRVSFSFFFRFVSSHPGLEGGNSTKATSGINGAGTRAQLAQGVHDSPKAFYEDTLKGARELARPELIKVLTDESAPAVHWLEDSFGLDMSVLGRLGGHSFPRTHRGKEQFPGMTITYALMEAIEKIQEEQPHRAKVLTKTKATRILTDANGAAIGVEYVTKGVPATAHGPVIIASGGYGADFGPDSLLAKWRPDLVSANYATTNGEHCTGDGIRLAEAIGAGLVDMKMVQVHPTGLVDPRDPQAKVKWLAAEALRGTGAILLNGEGKRFCNELGHRDYVSGEMNKGKGPYRLVLNSACSKEIIWHCKHYQGRGLMEYYDSGAALAKAIGIPPAKLQETFATYSKQCEAKKDEFGKVFFQNGPFRMDDTYYVAVVTPVVHYTMGGLHVNAASQVVGANGKAIDGLWAAGEVAGGVHGVNRLGGSSLLDCVVFGRVSGRNAAKYVLEKLLSGGGASSSSGVQLNIRPGSNGVTVEVSFNGKSAGVPPAATAPAAAPAASSSSSSSTPAPAAASSAPAKKDTNTVYTWEEIAKHNKPNDCWVVVNGVVLDVTNFLADHPGGKNAILLYAGKDATAEFNMLHKPDVITKYAPESVIGKAAAKPKL